MLKRVLLVLAAALCTFACGAQGTKVLLDFEDENDLKIWEFKKSNPSWSPRTPRTGRSA